MTSEGSPLPSNGEKVSGSVGRIGGVGSVREKKKKHNTNQISHHSFYGSSF